MAGSSRPLHGLTASSPRLIARRKIGFHMRNWIIWHYTFGQQTKKMFAKSHTHILYFTKEKPNQGMTNLTFNADAGIVLSAAIGRSRSRVSGPGCRSAPRSSVRPAPRPSKPRPTSASSSTSKSRR